MFSTVSVIGREQTAVDLGNQMDTEKGLPALWSPFNGYTKAVFQLCQH